MPRARRADVELRTEIRKNRRDLKRAEKDFKSFAKNAKGSLVGGFKGAFGQIAAFGSVAGLAEIGREVMDFERGFTRLGIQAELAGTKFDKGKFRTVITGLSLDTGIARGDVLNLADEIINLEGRSGLTVKKLETLTLAAQGTGAGMADLAGLTLGVRDAFKIKEADALNKVLSRFITIGGQGSVPLDKLARGLRSSAGAFARLQGEGEESAATLAAVFQVAAAGGITTVDETSTAVQRLVSNLEILGKTQAQELGIRDAAGELRPLDKILESIGNSGIIADPKKFKKAFASEPARRLLRILVKSRSEMDGFVESSKGSTALNDSAEKFASSTSGRMSKALNRMKLSIVEAFTPARLDAMVEAADAVADALGFVIDHWKLFLGAIVAVKAVQIGRTLMSWASSSRSLASALARISTEAGGADTKLGKLAKRPLFAKLARIAGPAAAAAGGFALGQFIGTNVVEGKKRRFAEGKKRQRTGLSANERVVQATQSLQDADAVTKTGALRPAFDQALQESLNAGRALTDIQREAVIALQGFAEIEAATGSSAQEMIRVLKRNEGIGPKVRQLVTSEADISPKQAQQIVAQDAAQQAALSALLGATVALTAASERPIEVKIDADVVAKANEKAADKRRRPSP